MNREGKEPSVDSDVISIWNACVQERVSPADLTKLMVGRTLEEVEPGASDFLVTSDGLFVRLPPGQSLSCARIVQAIGLYTDAEYFLPSGRQPEPVLTPITFHGVSVRGDAASVLASFERAGLVPVDLMTDQELFTIIYGGCLVFQFLPRGGVTSNPEDCRLASIEYNFGPSYCGQAPPKLS